MTMNELKENLKPSIKIEINGRIFTILEHIIWYMAKSNQNYDKYVLEDEAGNRDFRLWFSGETIGLSKIFEHEFIEPMPEILEYKGKKYKLSQDEFCIVKKAEGEEIYKVGECEIWWDYVNLSDKTKGLSLGRNWETWQREDLKSEYINIEDITIVS
jgi:hypothetical protein